MGLIGFIVAWLATQKLSYGVFFFGVGSALGFLLLSLVSSLSVLLDKNFIDFFMRLIFFLSVLVVAAIVSRASSWGLTIRTAQCLIPLSALSLSPLCLLFLTSFVPTVAWDVLGGEQWHPGYARRAIDVASSYTNDVLKTDGFQDRHYNTNVFMLAWSSWLARGFDGHFAGLPWFLLYSSLVAMAYGFGLAVTGSRPHAFLSSSMMATLPFLENHAVLAGYHELIIAVIFTGSVAIFELGFMYRSRTMIAMGMLFSLSLIFTKSTGLIYFLTVSLTLILVRLWRQSGFRGALGAGAALMCAVGIFFSDFQIDFFLRALGWEHSHFTITVAGRTQQLSSVPLTLIVDNLTQAVVKNASFSSTIALVLCFMLSTPRGSSMQTSVLPGRMVTVAYLLGCTVFTCTMLTDYGLMHAGIDSDRQFSRSLFPMAALAILSYPCAVRQVSGAKTTTAARESSGPFCDVILPRKRRIVAERP